jgi:hypothetical protein
MIELFGSTTAVKNLGRKADTPDIDSSVEPVWVQRPTWRRCARLLRRVSIRVPA